MYLLHLHLNETKCTELVKTILYEVSKIWAKFVVIKNTTVKYNTTITR
jgi:hypothetical protein